MAKNAIRKIIYFDKETICNILQEEHHGDYLKTEENISNSEMEADATVKLGIPFFSRIAFLFSGKIAASYIVRKDSSTTITSTELSEFEKLKDQLTIISNVQVHDIENSSTSLRVAGGYLRIIKGAIEGVDTKEFKTVMDNYDGYDTYSVDDKRFVRFNNSAFVSNYKRNDLLTTTMTLYCVPVGVFDRERFDFIKEISKMEKLFSEPGMTQTLEDLYPSPDISKESDDGNTENSAMLRKETEEDFVELFDVVYACVSTGDENE